MLAVNIIIISLISSVLTINDTIPEIPSRLLSQTNLLPGRSESTTTNGSFQQYIPIACFCDRSECDAYVKSIQPPILGLFTRDGQIVKSLKIKVNKGELMYIILIDRNSSIGNDTYFERTFYWHIADSQHHLLPDVPLDFEIRQQLSVTVLEEERLQFPIGLETKAIVINALKMTTGLSISTSEQSESKINYRYVASPFSQVVSVYQLFHEVVIHPGRSLVNYVRTGQTNARCSFFLLFSKECGSLQLLPSFLQRTAVFRQASVSLSTTINTIVSTDTSSTIVDEVETTTENLQKSATKVPSKSRKAVIIPIMVIIIFLVVVVLASSCYFKGPLFRRRLQHPTLQLLPETDEI